MVSHLCQTAEVSRSGYYNYFSSNSQDYRSLRDKEDEGNSRTYGFDQYSRKKL